MTFEWDEKKNLENFLKHNVLFEEAQEAFYDVRQVTIEDTSHSIIEKRFFCIGKTENGILTVRYTFRNNNIRIIGAGYWRKGARIYEKQNDLL